MESVGTGLAKLAAEVLRGASAEEVPLLAWGLVCGKAVGSHARAVSFTCGVLRVEVADPAWRTELAEMEMRFLMALKHLIPSDANDAQVQHIEFVLSQPVREPK